MLIILLAIEDEEPAAPSTQQSISVMGWVLRCFLTYLIGG